MCSLEAGRPAHCLKFSVPVVALIYVTEYCDIQVVSGEQASFDISLCAPRFLPSTLHTLSIAEGKRELWEAR